VLAQVGAALSAARARLAVIDGRYEEAWQLYRAVPPGTSWAREAAMEGVYLLRARGLHMQGARLLDQLLRGHADDVGALQLSLWRAESLFKGGRPAEARAAQEALAASLKRSAYVVERAAESRLLAPPETLAWLSDEEARGARAVSAGLYEVEAQLKQGQRDWDALLRAQRSGRYGAVEAARRLVARQGPALRALEQRVARLAPLWRAWGPSLAPVARALGLDAEQLSAARVAESARALAGRLAALEGLAGERARALAASLDGELRALRESLEGLGARQARLRADVERLSTQLKGAALARVRGALARMQLSAVEEVYWRKELSSERAAAAVEARRVELASLSRLAAQDEDAAALPMTLDHLAPFLGAAREAGEAQGGAAGEAAGEAAGGAAGGAAGEAPIDTLEQL